MWELETAFLIILALGTVVILAAWVVSTRVPTTHRIVKRVFWCPVQARNVSAEFQEAAWDGTLVEVNRCSAFSPPEAVTCEKACLRLDRLPPVRGSARAA